MLYLNNLFSYKTIILFLYRVLFIDITLYLLMGASGSQINDL